MISKQNSEGQTECFGCKKKGRFGLNWDSFLYNYNNEAYCLECLIEELEKLTKENQQLKEELNKYTDPKDLTLMFMYCDEKAKDKIKELEKQLVVGEKQYKDLVEEKEELKAENEIFDTKLCEYIDQEQQWINLVNMLKNQQKEFIEYLEEMLDSEIGVFAEVKVCDVLSKYKEITGVK